MVLEGTGVASSVATPGAAAANLDAAPTDDVPEHPGAGSYLPRGRTLVWGGAWDVEVDLLVAHGAGLAPTTDSGRGWPGP